jgi:hypothetical protein
VQLPVHAAAEVSVEVESNKEGLLIRKSRICHLKIGCVVSLIEQHLELAVLFCQRLNTGN